MCNITLQVQILGRPEHGNLPKIRKKSAYNYRNEVKQINYAKCKHVLHFTCVLVADLWVTGDKSQPSNLGSVQVKQGD